MIGKVTHIMPVIMGAIMGPMMLWMLHGALTGNGTSGWALVAFVAAHLIVLIALLAATGVAMRRFPRLQARLAHVHRPSWRHMGMMLGSATVAALIVHLTIHGGAV